MGSDYNTSGATNPQAVLNAYTNYLPALSMGTAGQSANTSLQSLIAANQQVNPTDPSAMAQLQLTQAQAALAANPNNKAAKAGVQTAQAALDQARLLGKPKGINELNLDQLSKYALPEAQIGQQVADSNAQAGAKTNLNQIKGAGGEAATAAVDLNKKLNPTFYNAQDKANEAVNSVNLKGLSPGEFAATERALNQNNTTTGNAGLVNPTNIIANAMNFGGAFNSKIPLAAQVSSNAANISQQSGVNPTNIALGQPNTSTATNFGAGQFANTNAGTGVATSNNAFNFGSGVLNSLTSGNNAAQSAGAQMAGQTSPAAYLNAV